MKRKYRIPKKSAVSQRIQSSHRVWKFDDLYKILELNIRSINLQKIRHKLFLFFYKKAGNIVKDLGKIIGASTLVTLIITIVGNYISGQRYYDELLDKYLTSMEVFLIKDELHATYLAKEHLKKKIQNNHDENITEEFKKQEAKYSQVKSLALSVTENTLRSLSRNDGMMCLPVKILNIHCIPGTRHNPERRQLLLTFLEESKLGFINPEDSKRPNQPLESFLEGINLSTLTDEKTDEKLDLEGIQLTRAILRKANFSRANLRGAHLNAADLKNARLPEIDLSDADLTKANLKNADLRYAILKRTILRRVNLIDARLEYVELDKKTDLKGAVYGETMDFRPRSSNEASKEISDERQEIKDKLMKKGAIEVKPGLDLSNLPLETRQALDEVFKEYKSDIDRTLLALRETDLSGVDLTKAKLVDADLREANFTDADLTGADLTGADLTGADLTGADLTGAKGAVININKAKLCNTILPTGEISDCPKEVS
jgi:uncharacterized protein YjbI with pentapeptide repeats